MLSVEVPKLRCLCKRPSWEEDRSSAVQEFAWNTSETVAKVFGKPESRVFIGNCWFGLIRAVETLTCVRCYMQLHEQSGQRGATYCTCDGSVRLRRWKQTKASTRCPSLTPDANTLCPYTRLRRWFICWLRAVQLSTDVGRLEVDVETPGSTRDPESLTWQSRCRGPSCDEMLCFGVRAMPT